MGEDQKVINFRGTDETAQTLEQLMADLKVSKRELLERMVGALQTSMQLEVTDQVPDLKQLSYHLGRVQEIYVSFVKQSRDREAGDASKIKEAQEQAKEIRSQVHELTENTKKELEEAQALVKAATEEAAQARKEAEKAKEDQAQSARLAQLAERAAAAAEERAKNLEAAASQAEEYKHQLSEVSGQKDELQKEFDDKINEFNARVRLQEESMENLKVKHSREMDNLNKQLNLECQEQILQMRQELWEKYQEKLTDRDDKISTLYSQISDLQDTVSQHREEKAILEEKLRVFSGEAKL